MFKVVIDLRVTQVRGLGIDPVTFVLRFLELSIAPSQTLDRSP
jgi:hypothetical protein